MTATTGKNVLVVDDEPNAVRVLSAILRNEGYHVSTSTNVDQAVSMMHTHEVDAVITDLKMPGKDGFQLFNFMSRNYPHTPVMFLTGYGTVESAVNAVKNGAYYYFIKPPDYSKLKTVLAAAIDKNAAQKQFEDVKRKACQKGQIAELLGYSPQMERIRQTIRTVTDSDSSVLILGDTGTGKEVIAGNLHYQGKRCQKPFVAVNCAAIPRDLLESELFGYDKGAFTGAVSSRIGKFEEAAEGTMFLDEIGELELTMQAKLLRVLQEREVVRLGANKKCKTRFRLISSTNRNLKHDVEQGRFREDLFYRINVVQIDAPALREHRQDIPLLAAEFLNVFSLRENRPFIFAEKVMDILLNYDWPGNVRQLKNVIERSVVLARSEGITESELPEEVKGCRSTGVSLSAVQSLKEMEQRAITDALLLFHGNKAKAARKLGISRKTFYRKMKDAQLTA